MISEVTPAARSDSRKAATLPTSSIVTLRRSGAFSATTSRILPKPLMPRGGQRLDRPGRDAVDADALRARGWPPGSARGLERRLGQAHGVVVGNAAQRPQIGQGEQRRARARAAAAAALAMRREAVARDVVGDPERLARQAFEEVAGDRFAWARSRSSGRSRRRSARPAPRAANRRVDLGVVGDVAVEDQRRAELGGELGDALLEALALVAEGQLGAFAAAGPGDAVGDRAVRQHAGDEEALAGEKSHGTSAFARGRCEDSGMRPEGASRALDSRVTCRYLRERIQFRSSLESVKWAVLPAHFFWPIVFCPTCCR